MSRAEAILATLVVYKIVLVALGAWANRLSRDGDDFFLAGRRLPPSIAALSAAASSSSVWTLLGVSGFAYAKGLSALWIFPACVGGFWINWRVLAPALRRHSASEGSLTVTEVLAGPLGTPGRKAVVGIASAIVLLCLLAYVAAQFQGAGKALSEVFALDPSEAILVGAGVVVLYTLLGGFWAVSLTDTLQGAMMVLAAVCLPTAALVAVGGPGELMAGVAAVEVPGYTSLFRELPLAGAFGLVAGLLGIGLGYPGQPHVVNRMMAVENDAAIRKGRLIAMTWAVFIYAGTILVGLSARVLLPELEDHEGAFVALTNELFSPVIAGIMVAAVLSAIMSTADSQLLVAAAAIGQDMGVGRGNLTTIRGVILGLALLATGLALFASADIFSSVLFAWSAMGAAFGPLLLVVVWKGRPAWTYCVAAMAIGFCVSVAAYSFPATKGGFFERVLPVLLAGAVAWWGSRRRP